MTALLGLYKKGSKAFGKMGLEARSDNEDIGFSTGNLTNGSLQMHQLSHLKGLINERCDFNADDGFPGPICNSALVASTLRRG